MGTSLFLSLFFSTVGAGFFLYGKRQSEIWFMLAGLLLCVYPYFISNTRLMSAIGTALLAVPFIARRFEE